MGLPSNLIRADSRELGSLVTRFHRSSSCLAFESGPPSNNQIRGQQKQRQGWIKQGGVAGGGRRWNPEPRDRGPEEVRARRSGSKMAQGPLVGGPKSGNKDVFSATGVAGQRLGLRWRKRPELPPLARLLGFLPPLSPRPSVSPRLAGKHSS